MYIIVAADMKKVSAVFRGVLVFAVFINTISVCRAHQRDFWKGSASVLRPEDRALVAFNRQYIAAGRADTVAMEYREAAFAQFPVHVTKEQFPFVIRLSGGHEPFVKGRGGR
jgi:hypothetical protein